MSGRLHGPHGRRSRLEHDHELVAFLRREMPGKTLAQMAALCAETFPPDRVPSRSALGRWAIRQITGKPEAADRAKQPEVVLVTFVNANHPELANLIRVLAAAKVSGAVIADACSAAFPDVVLLRSTLDMLVVHIPRIREVRRVVVLADRRR